MSKAKYKVEYYISGCCKLHPDLFTSKAAAKRSMIEFMGDTQTVRSYSRHGYKRVGSLRLGYIAYDHPVFGLDRYVELTLIK
jgi:hypothetical protein